MKEQIQRIISWPKLVATRTREAFLILTTVLVIFIQTRLFTTINFENLSRLSNRACGSGYTKDFSS